MSLVTIQQAIFSRLDGSSLPPRWYPNRSGVGASQAQPTGDHLRVDILPAITDSIGLNSLDQERGILQVTVMTKPDTGTIPAAKIVEQVLALFPRNTELRQDGLRVRFDRTGYPGPSMQDGAWYATPVTIPYNVIT